MEGKKNNVGPIYFSLSTSLLSSFPLIFPSNQTNEKSISLPTCLPFLSSSHFSTQPNGALIFTILHQEVVDQTKKQSSFFNGNPLLGRWVEWGYCSLRGWEPDEVWIRATGIPVHLWEEVVLKSIGDLCSAFVDVKRDTASGKHFKLARIKVRGNGRAVLASVKLKVRSSFLVLIWLESDHFSMRVTD